MISTDDLFIYLFIICCLYIRAPWKGLLRIKCVYIHDPLVQSSFGCFRKMVRISSSTVDGGLSGGLERTAWFYPRLPSFIRNISVCTLMRCHHLFENMSPRTGSSRCDTRIHVIMLSSFLQLSYIFLIAMQIPGIVKILLCLSLSQMQRVLLLFGWKVYSFSQSSL